MKIITKYWKFLIPLLLALAIALGLLQRSQDPYLHSTHPGYQNLADDKSLRAYYEQAKSLAQTGSTSTKATFLAVGDIMLSRDVAAAIKKAGNVDLPFRNMADILRSTDFNFANLESPLVEQNPIVGGNGMQFAAPKENIAALKDYNFIILNLANNHALDDGIQGAEFTRQALDGLGIKHTGTGNTVDEAWQPAVVNANGIKICYIGASYSPDNNSGKAGDSDVARIGDIARLQKSIAAAKAQCDFVVATMHAGVEYTRSPNDAQIKFAHGAIDDGADMVIGAHPHWVQTIEKYNGKYIFYSLGNFIFDQMWSQDTKEGLALKITVSKIGCHPGIVSASEQYPGSSTGQKLDSGSEAGMTNTQACADNLQGARTPAKLDSIELLPVIIENYSTPRPATADEAKKILQKIGETESILK